MRQFSTSNSESVSPPTKGRGNFKVCHGGRTLTPLVFTKMIDPFIFKSINDEKGMFTLGLGLKPFEEYGERRRL